MAVHMEKTSNSSVSEIAQRLYDKNIEMENRRRRSAQEKVSPDPNSWQQMRENYEAIILEDHAFSELKNIEYALWHLHYRRIEEFRSHMNAVLASGASTTTQGVKVPPRPERIAKIRVQFKTFLSEATGFYHDLILKIRSKYGLPFGVFSDDYENQSAIEKDRKRPSETKKAIISCHRCLIYLGDLARYKVLYGENDCKARDFSAASSYYLQASSILPSSGNPHHQLAILAAYSGDELLAVYRYFRSLTVDFPFTTARENLIIAFEKNRQNYSQLLANAKNVTNGSPIRRNNRGKVKMELKPNANTKADANISKEETSSLDICKAFTTRFVRLNGILFTRTSLETFSEVLSEVSNDLNKLLSTGAEEVLKFGVDTSENERFIIRLVSILISTVHNVTREGEGQTYADILQRTVLLQNALTAVFELLGHVLNRCSQLLDPWSSFLLPGILVYVEWLASCPDVAASSDMDKQQEAAKSAFWNHFVFFLNKLSAGMVDMDNDDDESCFSKTCNYKEGNNEICLALWEDFELRGFLPLQPAQAILDFSRKHSIGDGKKEKIARVKRILAAGKALSNVVKVDHKTFSFDLQVKKFTIGTNPQTTENLIPSTRLDSSQPVVRNQEVSTEAAFKVAQPTAQIHMDGDDEDDEVIVFKPAMNVNRSDIIIPSKTTIPNGVDSGRNAVLGDSKYYNGLLFADEIGPQAGVVSSLPLMQNLQPTTSNSSVWSMNQPTSLVNNLEVTNSLDKVIMKPGVQETRAFSHSSMFSIPVQQSINGNVSSGQYCRNFDPFYDVNSTIITSTALPSYVRSPVKRPVRHNGPPPGFGSVTPKLANDNSSGTNVSAADNHLPLMDDYSWLDGYQPPSSMSMGALGLNHSVNYPSHPSAPYNNLDSMVNTHLPFPGKQAATNNQQQLLHVEKQNGWDDLLAFDHLNLHEQLQKPQQLMNGSQQFPRPLHSMWTGGQYPV